MIKIFAEILFSALMLLLGVFSLIMVYVLLRFGKSKILGVILSAFYLILITTLYAAAVANFKAIPFARF